MKSNNQYWGTCEIVNEPSEYIKIRNFMSNTRNFLVSYSQFIKHLSIWNRIVNLKRILTCWNRISKTYFVIVILIGKCKIDDHGQWWNQSFRVMWAKSLLWRNILLEKILQNEKQRFNHRKNITYNVSNWHNIYIMKWAFQGNKRCIANLFSSNWIVEPPK